MAKEAAANPAKPLRGAGSRGDPGCSVTKWGFIRTGITGFLVGYGVVMGLANLPPPSKPLHASAGESARSAMSLALPIPPLPPPVPENIALSVQLLPLPIPPIPPPTPEALRAEAGARLKVFEWALHAQSRN
jgi:hypothetical protein